VTAVSLPIETSLVRPRQSDRRLYNDAMPCARSISFPHVLPSRCSTDRGYRATVRVLLGVGPPGAKELDQLFAINAKGTFFTLRKAARYGASKMPLRYAVEVLALELGHRGVTVTTILPTVIEGAAPCFGHSERAAPVNRAALTRSLLKVSESRGGRCGRCNERSTSSSPGGPGRCAGSSW
jgi:NAD(P)-dependent dehydrogenase (short-subunit alcohol dehydrogenase family)